MPQTLSLTALPGLPLIEPGDDLPALIIEGLGRAGVELLDGDVIVVAQKVVSKQEGRLVDLTTVAPSPEAQALAEEVDKDPRVVELVLRESRKVLRTRPGLLVVEHRLGFVCANAGIDRSNLQGGDKQKVLLLPEDPDASAQRLREALNDRYDADVGVLIVDSHGRAWRIGTVGVAIGVAYFPAVIDKRGDPDLFGRTLKNTEVGLADEVGAAASVLMGQADEGLPVVHVRGLPYPLRESRLDEILRPEEQDLFR
ncbi:MAG: coenzyme F420-0:L-glutamate ligase [Anaerolineales bacterium]|nr:coenzyme F420-0:L-glutamate ligase [Anaerolineales bacterium]